MSLCFQGSGAGPQLLYRVHSPYFKREQRGTVPVPTNFIHKYIFCLLQAVLYMYAVADSDILSIKMLFDAPEAQHSARLYSDFRIRSFRSACK
jgi:hypothetical protein